MPLNRPLFVLACVAAVLAVVVELALGSALGGAAAGPLSPGAGGLTDVSPLTLAAVQAQTPPGAGIRHLALFDGLLCFALAVVGAGALGSQRATARVQGIVTLVVSFFWLLGALVAAVLAFVQLLVMVGLFVAAPFGTIAYLAIWGFFPVGSAATLLGLLLLLKLVMLGLLLAAQPKFLEVKGLMTLIALSVVLQLVLGLLHGWLPRPVVAIGDQLWALVTAIVALVWALIMLITSIPAVLRAIRVSAARRQ